MKIAIDDIKATPKELVYTEEVDELNVRLGRGGVRDYRVEAGLAVELEYYRAGLDIFFRGARRGDVHGCCARCLDDYTFGLERDFRVVLTPRAAALGDAKLTADDMVLSTYEGAQIDVAPLVYEEAILALPTRPLCAEACRGLCPRCGANLNAGPCACPASGAEPRRSMVLPRPK